eukprot:542993_1
MSKKQRINYIRYLILSLFVLGIITTFMVNNYGKFENMFPNESHKHINQSLSESKLKNNHYLKHQFLSNLHKYKLFISNLSNNTNIPIPNILYYSQYSDYYIHTNSNTFIFTMCESDGLGIGNILSKYWAARATAFWFDYNFEWNLCKSKSFQQKYFSKKLFMSFFSKNVISKKRSHSTSFLFPVIYAKTHNMYLTQYIHPTSLLFLFYNKYYTNILNSQYIQSITSYYQYNNLQHKIELTNVFDDIHSDIVIHIRCGDIIHSLGKYNKHYGFLTTQFLKYSVTNATQIAFGINWMDSKITKQTTIWIVSQLSAKSLRPHERYVGKQCSYLVNYLADNCLKEFFFPAHVKIKYDSDINDDFYKMINAPLLICSTSSFCLQAAIANKRGYVVLPKFGSWVDLELVTKIDKNYSDWYSNDIFHIARHSKLLPSNNVIVANIETKWFLNKVRDYNEDHEDRSNITRLAQYLVTH